MLPDVSRLGGQFQKCFQLENVQYPSGATQGDNIHWDIETLKGLLNASHMTL